MAKGYNKKPRDKRSKLASILRFGLIASGCISNTGNFSALPTEGSVVEGSASISSQTPTHQIIHQNTDKVIIDWRNFSIGTGELTEFRQPSSQSIALNRVLGGEVSYILGTIKANGNIWLINPAGLVFGDGAVIDLPGRLLATTSNINNADFMKDSFRFHQEGSKYSGILIEGKVKIKDAGLVSLVAPGIENRGVIVGNVEKLELASGTEFQVIDTYGDQLIYFSPNSLPIESAPQIPGEAPMQSAITIARDAKIDTPGAKVLLTTSDAQRLVKSLINMEGVIEADAITHLPGETTKLSSAGEIHLLGSMKTGYIGIDGQLSAQGLRKGEKGGTITVTAPRVDVLENASLDTSGNVGGGTILVGGDYQGKGTLPHADLLLFIADLNSLVMQSKVVMEVKSLCGQTEEPGIKA